TARINGQLALVALTISPALLLISLLYRLRLRRQWHEVKKFETSAFSVVQEALAARRVVKAFGQEEREAARLMCRSGEGVRARLLQRARGAIAFRDVSFAYEQGRPVLQRVAFDIDPGSRVGLVGATGAGKTTLISLLTRFYDPTDGQILLDGVDLRDYKLADL